MSLKYNRKRWNQEDVEKARKEFEEDAERYAKADRIASEAVWEAWDKVVEWAENIESETSVPEAQESSAIKSDHSRENLFEFKPEFFEYQKRLPHREQIRHIQTMYSKFGDMQTIIEEPEQEESIFDTQTVRISYCSQPEANKYFGEGNRYFDHGDYKKAQQFYTKAIEYDSGHTAAYTHRGLTFFYQKMFSESLVDLNKSLELDKENSFGHLCRVMYYLKQKKYGEAIQDCINLRCCADLDYEFKRLSYVIEADIRLYIFKENLVAEALYKEMIRGMVNKKICPYHLAEAIGYFYIKYSLYEMALFYFDTLVSVFTQDGKELPKTFEILFSSHLKNYIQNYGNQELARVYNARGHIIDNITITKIEKIVAEDLAKEPRYKNLDDLDEDEEDAILGCDEDTKEELNKELSDIKKCFATKSQSAEHYKKEYHKAIVDFSKAIELDNNNPIYYYNRAATYYYRLSLAIYHIDSYSKRIYLDLTKAVELNRNFMAAYILRAKVYDMHFCLPLKVVDEHIKILEIDPNYKDAYLEVSYIYRTVPECHYRAINDYNTIIRFQPTIQEAIEEKKRCLEILERYSTDNNREYEIPTEVVDSYKSLKTVYMQYLGLAREYKSIGNFEKAIEFYELSLQHGYPSELLRAALDIRYLPLDKEYRHGLEDFSQLENIPKFQASLEKWLCQLKSCNMTVGEESEIVDPKGCIPMPTDQLQENSSAVKLELSEDNARLSQYKRTQKQSGDENTIVELLETEESKSDTANLRTHCCSRRAPEAKKYFGEGNNYFDHRDYKKAQECYSRAIECDDSHAEAYTYRGLTFFHQEKFSESLADLNKSLELDKEFSFGYLCRAIYYLQQKRYEEAIQDCIKLRQCADLDYEFKKHSYFIEADIRLYIFKEVNVAETLYKEFVHRIVNKTICPYHIAEAIGCWYSIYSLYEIALIYFDALISITTQAEKTIPQTLEILFSSHIKKNIKNFSTQELADLYNERGHATERIGSLFFSKEMAKRNYEKAVQDFSKAIELNPQDPEFYYNRAITNWMRSPCGGHVAQYSKQIYLDLAKVIELKPDFTPAYILKGKLYEFHLCLFQEALRNYALALKLSPTNNSAHDCLQSMLKTNDLYLEMQNQNKYESILGDNFCQKENLPKYILEIHQEIISASGHPIKEEEIQIFIKEYIVRESIRRARCCQHFFDVQLAVEYLDLALQYGYPYELLLASIDVDNLPLDKAYPYTLVDVAAIQDNPEFKKLLNK